MSNERSGKTRIPIQIIIDGVYVVGEITYLTANDMVVIMHDPTSGLSTCLHVPWFAAGYPPNQLWNASGITQRGTERAHSLLKELYDYSIGRPSGWGINKLGKDGNWHKVPLDLDSWPVKEVKDLESGGRGR